MIVVPALHPSREVIARVAELRPGEVHRPGTILESVGGKAVNVARFALQMGGEVRLLVVADDGFRDALAEDEVLGIRSQDHGSVTIVPGDSAARIDLALVDDAGRTTVVNGSAARPSASAVAEVEAATLGLLHPDDILVLAGSLPPGTDGLLERLTRRGRERGARVIVDASGRWLGDALRGRPQVVKINESEAAEASSAPTTAWLARPPGFAEVEVLAVSAAAEGLRAWIGDEAWRLTPPRALAVANTLGAGDAVTAGLAIGLDAGRSPLDALRLGMAMAAARLRHIEVRLVADDVAELERAVSVERLA